MILRTLKEAFKGLWTSFLQWVINRISDIVFVFKKQEALRLCREYNAKYYVIQNGYFAWSVLRAKDVNLYKSKGLIGSNVNAKELQEISAFVATPTALSKGIKVLIRKK